MYQWRARRFHGRYNRRFERQPYTDDSQASEPSSTVVAVTHRAEPVVVNGELYGMVSMHCDEASCHPDLVTVEEPPTPGPYLLLVNTAHYLYQAAEQQGTLESVLDAAIEQAIEDFFNKA